MVAFFSSFLNVSISPKVCRVAVTWIILKVKKREEEEQREACQYGCAMKRVATGWFTASSSSSSSSISLQVCHTHLCSWVSVAAAFEYWL